MVICLFEQQQRVKNATDYKWNVQYFYLFFLPTYELRGIVHSYFLITCTVNGSNESLSSTLLNGALSLFLA